MTYNPIYVEGKPYRCTNSVERETNAVIRSAIHNVETNNDGTRLPNNVLYFNRDSEKLHPTQKPVILLDYLIRTYTNEGDLVLDNTMGSGSTGVACVNSNRDFIGMELNPEYFAIAKNRIDEAVETKENSLW